MNVRELALDVRLSLSAGLRIALVADIDYGDLLPPEFCEALAALKDTWQNMPDEVKGSVYLGLDVLRIPDWNDVKDATFADKISAVTESINAKAGMAVAKAGGPVNG